MKRQLHEVLGVDEQSTQQDIKKAYKRKANKMHPDKPSGDKEQFQELQLAYSVLSDPEKRKRYEETGEQTQQKPFNVEESLRNLFNQTIEALGDRVESVDIIETVERKLKNDKRSFEAKVKSATKVIDKLKKALKRIKRDKSGLLAGVFNQRIAHAEHVKAENKKGIDMAEQLLKALDGFEYENAKEDFPINKRMAMDEFFDFINRT